MFCRWCKGNVAEDAGPCPLSFTCPTCAAAPGSKCKRPSGHEASELHAARLELEFDPPDPEDPPSHADRVRPDGPETDRGGLIGQQPY